MQVFDALVLVSLEMFGSIFCLGGEPSQKLEKLKQ